MMKKKGRTTTNTRTLPKLFCNKCGARAEATCACGVSYIPARVYAEQAIVAHPEKSNRAIAEETGISHETIRQVREATGNNLAVRIGPDGKVRRVPRHLIPWHNNPMPNELQHVPAAGALMERIMPYLTALRREGKYHETTISPSRVNSLLNSLLTELYECMLPISRATVCGDCARNWKIDGKPTKEEIDVAGYDNPCME
jgi:hypothetical protein